MKFLHSPAERRAFRNLPSALGFSLVWVLLVAGCGGPTDTPAEPPPAPDIHNPALGVTVIGLPMEWTVTTNSGQHFELRPSDTTRPGLVSVSVGPEERGVNLVAAVDAHKVEIEGREGGVYSGAQELSGPLGVAFYSRGRYSKDSALVEETLIFALHPTASRMLVFDYSYPAADDSSSRVSELIELFALVE